MNRTDKNGIVKINTKNDLSIALTENGIIKNINAGASEFTGNGMGLSGFRIKEHGQENWENFLCTVDRTNGDLSVHGNSDDLALDLDAQLIVHDDYIEIIGSITDRSKIERSVDLNFGLPGGGFGTRWWCDIAETIDPTTLPEIKPVVQDIEGDYFLWIEVYSVVPQPFIVSIVDENGQERFLHSISGVGADVTNTENRKSQDKVIGADLFGDGKWDIYVVNGVKESDFVDGNLHLRILNSNRTYNNIDVCVNSIYLFNTCDREKSVMLAKTEAWDPEPWHEDIKDLSVGSWTLCARGQKFIRRIQGVIFPFDVNSVAIPQGSWTEFLIKEDEHQTGWEYAKLSDNEPICADSQGVIHGLGYPWATVTQKNGGGFTLGVWPGMVCSYNFNYHVETGNLELSLSYGLSSVPKQAEFRNSAPFHFVLYRTDDEWGFRAATERYYKFVPELFKRRTDRFGFWWGYNRFIGRTAVSPDWVYHGLEGLYGFMEIHEADLYPRTRKIYDSPDEWYKGYREKLKAYFPRHTELGISVLPYRMFYHNSLHVKGYMDGTLPALPESAEAAIRMLETCPVPFGNGYGHYIKEVILSSTFKNRDGQYDLRISKSPIAPTGRVIFRTNVSPYLYEDKPEIVTNARAELDFVKDVLDNVPEIAGIYYDQGAGNGGVDYAPDHIKYARSPLVPGPGLGRTDVYEFGRWISDILHRYGKYSFTNGGMDMSNHTVWSTMAFDCHGVEQTPLVTNERIYRFLRTISGPKSLATYMCEPLGAFEIKAFDRAVQLACVYNIFPPSVELTDHISRKKVNTAELVAPYGKLFQDMYKAEWQPVTHAHCDKPYVTIERYGPMDGKCYLGVYNKREEEEEIILSIDFHSIGMGQVRKAVEFVAVKKELPVEREGNICRISLKLPGLQLAVVQIGEEEVDDFNEITNFYKVEK